MRRDPSSSIEPSNKKYMIKCEACGFWTSELEDYCEGCGKPFCEEDPDE